MVLLNQRYHGSESRGGSIATGSGSYPHASLTEPSGISIELTRTTVKTDDMGNMRHNNPRVVRTSLSKARGFDGDF